MTEAVRRANLNAMNAETPSPIRPFDARMLAVGDGHWLYVEEVGRKGGRPCLFLHGGPGSGAQHVHRALFNPERDHVFLFDQRGAGRSHPYLSLHANTTDHLVRDIEIIRAHFGIDQWLVVGGSWGSTLAVAYAEAYPHRVTGLVVRAVLLGTRREAEWAFVEGPRKFRTELFAAFRDALPGSERGDVLTAYLNRILGSDKIQRHHAAHTWFAYERTLSELQPRAAGLPENVSAEARLPPTPIVEAHYIRHDFFLEPGQLLANADRLADIAGVIVQGRYDILCPPEAACALHAAWPKSRLQIIEGAGHALSEPGVERAIKTAISEL